jgi:hypothetical protein
MTTNITTRHDCADHGCLAAMLGLALDDTAGRNAEEDSSLIASTTA